MGKCGKGGVRTGNVSARRRGKRGDGGGRGEDEDERFEAETEERDRKGAVRDRKSHLESGAGGLMEIGGTIDVTRREMKDDRASGGWRLAEASTTRRRG